MKNNACVFLIERYSYELRDKEYVDYLFGEGYLEDFGTYVDEKLIEEYKCLENRMKKIQKELEKIYDKSNS